MKERRMLWVLSLLMLGFALSPVMSLAQAQATAPGSAGDAESFTRRYCLNDSWNSNRRR